MTNQPANRDRRAARKTRASVLLIDRLAGWIIMIGGIGTIGAVSTVGLFLLWVVVPLFSAAELTPSAAAPALIDSRPLYLGIDEHQQIAAALDPTGVLQVVHLPTGARLPAAAAGVGAPTAVSSAVDGGKLCVADDAAKLRIVTVGFKSEFIDANDLTPPMQQLTVHESLVDNDRVVQRLTTDQWRSVRASLQKGPEIPAPTPMIAALDMVQSPLGSFIAVLGQAGDLHLVNLREKKNFLTGKTTLLPEAKSIEYKPHTAGLPKFVRLLGQGDQLLLGWTDGTVQRFFWRDGGAPELAEELHLFADATTKLTVLELLLGRNTVLAGDSTGVVQAGFLAEVEHDPPPDGRRLSLVRSLGQPDQAAVTCIASSQRSRLLVVGYDQGRARLFHATTGKQLAEAVLPEGGAVLTAGVAPKDDGLFAATATQFGRWSVNLGHPEVSVATLFRPVWYEGYPRPTHTWQSSSGTIDSEPKFGLMPLVFGTLKATFYSMLFAAPIALLAAIFSSEFLRPQTKARVKPLIEMMASLPSVVLGFLAALVFAPVVEHWVMPILTALITVPVTLLLAAHLWQLAPISTLIRFTGVRLALIFACIPLGIVFAWRLAPIIERWFFDGDLRTWLDGQHGTGIGAWMFFLLPLGATVLTMLRSLWVAPAVRRLAVNWTRAQAALMDLGLLLATMVGVVGFAYLGAMLLDYFAFDPRGGIVGTYVQRNAMAVSFVMAFAVIPIIYTIAEDALTSVPQHLRSASLGAGATTWQTAMLVVAPTAMSGLFSAVMIGLGRVVGETMIVLMAGGNTAEINGNIFSGFRTLSANIAVELPEASRNSSHYRILFLAGLALFVLTFIVNTAAEVIRLRFRRRSGEL